MKKISLKENNNKIVNRILNSNSIKKELDFIDYSQENFILIGVNTKNEIVYKEVLFKGGLNYCMVDYSIIFKKLLLNGCSGFITAHNHPSNNLSPSLEDEKIKNDIKKISNLFKLRYLDNIIFNKGEYLSFYDEDLL